MVPSTGISVSALYNSPTTKLNKYLLSCSFKQFSVSEKEHESNMEEFGTSLPDTQTPSYSKLLLFYSDRNGNNMF